MTVDEFKIQYRAAVHKMERWAQAASRDGSTADSDTEIAGLLGAHRLLLETCERRGTYFVDWVTTEAAARVALGEPVMSAVALGLGSITPKRRPGYLRRSSC